MDYNLLLAYGLGLLLLYVIIRLLVVPLKLLLLFCYNAFIGGVAIWVLNLAAAYFGLYVPLNPATIITAGLLGIPGVVLLFALSRVLA